MLVGYGIAGSRWSMSSAPEMRLQFFGGPEEILSASRLHRLLISLGALNWAKDPSWSRYLQYAEEDFILISGLILEFLLYEISIQANVQQRKRGACRMEEQSSIEIKETSRRPFDRTRELCVDEKKDLPLPRSPSLQSEEPE